MQGKHVGDNKYSKFIRRTTRSYSLLSHLAELRIHEDTERGDNDTIKTPNGQNVVIDGKTCADR